MFISKKGRVCKLSKEKKDTLHFFSTSFMLQHSNETMPLLPSILGKGYRMGGIMRCLDSQDTNNFWGFDRVRREFGCSRAFSASTQTHTHAESVRYRKGRRKVSSALPLAAFLERKSCLCLVL